MKKIIKNTNFIILGFIMLIGGLTKIFLMGVSGLSQMLQGIGFVIPTFFAWLLIIAEIGSGIAILAKWNLKYATIIPAVIVLVAIAFYWTAPFLQGKVPLQLTQTLVHLGLASNYLLIGRR